MNYTAMDDDDIEINFRDLLIYVFLHWRSILLAAVLAGLIVGGYKAYALHTAGQEIDTIDTLKDSGDDYQSRLKAAEGLQQVIDATNRQLEQKTSYLDHSILMQINPNQEAAASADVMLAVPGNAADNAISVLETAYQSRLLQGEYLGALAKEMDTEVSYLTELLSIRQGKTLNPQQNTIILQDGKQNSKLVDSFTISAVGVTQAQADQILDAVLQEMSRIAPDLSVSISAHDIAVINRYENTLFNQDLMTQQVNAASDMATLQQSITTYQKNLKDINLKDQDPIAGAVSARGMIKTFLKWGVVSGIVLMLIGFAFYGILYILSPFLLTREQALAHCPAILLGAFSNAEERLYKNNLGFDRWLRKLGDYRDKHAAWEDVLEMVTANLSVYAKDMQTILLSSAVDTGLSAKLQAELMKRIPDKQFILGDQLEINAASRSKLAAADGVILIEKYGETRLRVLDDTLAIIKSAQKNVLGMILE